MKYLRAAIWEALARTARRLHLPWADDWEDAESMAKFICSLDFEPVMMGAPTAWQCEHFTIGSNSLTGRPTCGLGCTMHPAVTTTAV